MASTQIEKAVQIYKSVAQAPVLTGARISNLPNNGISVQSVWSRRNLERKINQKFMQCHTLNSDLQLISESFPTDITSELLSAVTENEQYKAVLRHATVENTSKQFIEIWDKRKLLKNYDLAALDVHGDVYTTSDFVSFNWSPDNTKLLYIAEKKLPKSEPFYKQKPLDKKDKKGKEEDKEKIVGDEYIFKPDWGEQLVGKHLPVIAVLDTTTDIITILSGVPDELSPGQVLWTKNGEHVVGVAWKHEPRRLGLFACTNRLSWIFLLRNGEYKKLSRDGCAVRAPRISPDGKYLVWLEREAGGAHHAAHRLMCLNLESEDSKPETILDIVDTSKTINNGKQFFGIYGRLPERCWSNDSQYLFLSTTQQANIRSYIIDIRTKAVVEIENDTSSLSILDVHNNVIAFLKTSLLESSHLTMGQFKPEVLNDGNIVKMDVTAPIKIEGFENLTYEMVEYNYDNDDSVKCFNYIYFGPKTGKKKSVPIVLTPHGGPHANYANIFSLDSALYALLGFGVIQVNFRGSTGMGATNVEYLLGKVGNTDVKDCVIATQAALKKYPWLDSSRMGLSGGSHGGFLVTHLSAQYPDLYKAVVARNPVIDVATMFFTSDLPDCRNALTKEEKITYRDDVCAAETSYPYADPLPPEINQVEMYTKMFKASPISHVDKVKAPTLLCIGTNDLRVPSSQGKTWYHRLKANNIKTKMLVYEDDHSLSSVGVEMDHIINICLWLLEHTSVNKDTE